MSCGAGGAWFLSFFRGLVLPLAALVLLPPGVMNFLHSPTTFGRTQKQGTILQSYVVQSRVHYRYAKTFISSRVINPTDWKQRVNFTVVLPENAYISSFVMEVGGQFYETTVTERMQPDVKFTDGQLNEIEAVRLRDSNVFRASVCLAGGGTVASFYLTYEELLKRRMGAYHHVINLCPEQVAQDMNVTVHIREGRNITVLRVPSLQSGHEIDPKTRETDDSPLVQVIQEKSNEAKIILNPTPEQQRQWRRQWNLTKQQREKLAAREEGISADRGLEGQLVVLYDVSRDPAPSPNSGGELVIKDGYFVHFFSPAALPPFNRHLVLVVDVSKSMSGQKMKNLKKALKEMLGNLKKTEYFSIIKFNDKKSAWSPFPRVGQSQKIRVIPATPKYVKKAKKHIRKLVSSGGSGGTKTIQGLMKGISVARKSRTIGGNHTIFPMIVLVTDGETDAQSSEEETIDEKEAEEAGPGNLGGHWEIPVFTLGFVPDADMPFLRAISRRSAGGWASRVYLASDVNLQISELYAEFAWPVLGGIRFDYCPNVGGLEVDPTSLTQTRFYSAVSESEIVVAGKLKNYDKRMVMQGNFDIDAEFVNCSVSNRMISGFINATSARGKMRFPFRSTVDNSTFPIGRLWAYMMVNQLTELEAAQKAWGPFWTERILSGAYFLRKNLSEYLGGNEIHNATRYTEKKSLAKIMAKKYSFVSPGMTLMFAELKDDLYLPWDSPYLDSSDRELNQGLEKTRFDYEKGGGCNDQKQGLFWIPLPHELRPASLCSIGIHNSSCVSEETEDNGHTEKYPLVKSLEELIWLKDVKRGSHIILPKGHRGADHHYKLGFGQEDEQFGKCKTPSGEPGHCRHLHYCLLKDFATDYTYFLNYFCHIESSASYVGVCCPDYLYKNKIYHGIN